VTTPVTTPGVGGLPARRPDQDRDYPPAGVQPGSYSGIIRARVIIISGTGSGLFVYEGLPGPGNPPVASITESATDPFGNAVTPLANFGYEAGAHFGIDNQGQLYLSNAAGTTTIFLSPLGEVIAIGASPTTGNSGITISPISSSIGGVTFPAGMALSALPFLVYSGTPAAGNLLASMAPAAGSDVFGNSYNSGFEVQGSGDASIQIRLSGGVPFLILATGAAEESQAADVQAFITNPGSSETLTGAFRGPQGISPYDDSVQVFLGSAAKDGSLTATGSLVYVDTSSVTHLPLEWGNTGVAVFSAYAGDDNTYQTERVTAGQPGQLIVDSVTPAQFCGTLNPGVGSYKLHGQICFTEGNAAGAASFEFAGTAVVGSMRVVFRETIGSTPFTNGNQLDITAFNSAATTATFSNHFHLVTFDGTISFTTAGDLGIFAACTVAADTFTIEGEGTYMELQPIGPQ
jgi:hypothetical protein